MSTLSFDTHRFIGRMKDAGMNEKQAEVMADVFREYQDSANVATKNDLMVTESALRKDIAVIESNLRKDMAEMKFDLLKWIIGLSMAQFALIIGILMKLQN